MKNDGWKEFLTLCTKMSSCEEYNDFFSLFLTIEERETLAKRYLIIKALEEGILTQREIAEKFKVSISQITRGSNALKIADFKVKEILQK